MPKQLWWLFRFIPPSDVVTDGHDVLFATAGNQSLYYRLSDNTCIAREKTGRPLFVNSSIAAFAQMLVLWDTAYRRNEAESPDDSGEDWAHGDLILRDMKEAMLALDPAAFADSTNFWPAMVSDMAE